MDTVIATIDTMLLRGLLLPAAMAAGVAVWVVVGVVVVGTAWVLGKLAEW